MRLQNEMREESGNIYKCISDDKFICKCIGLGNIFKVMWSCLTMCVQIIYIKINQNS